MPKFITPVRASRSEELLSPGSMTAGGMGRQFREERAAARGREEMHMQSSLGAVTTNETATLFAEGQKKFGDYVSSRTKEINKTAASIQPQYDTAYTKLVASRDAALSKLGSKKDIDDEWDSYIGKGTKLEFWSGTPESPGKKETTVKLPKDVVVPFATALANNTYKVIDNKVYLHGRGQEVYDAYDKTILEIKDKFYSKVAPDIKKYNNEIDSAKSSLSTQFKDATANLNIQKGVAEGEVSAAKTGLAKEQKSNSDTLASIRTSYTDRLSRINEALSGTIIRTAESTSQKAPVKQIDSRVSTAQPTA